MDAEQLVTEVIAHVDGTPSATPDCVYVLALTDGPRAREFHVRVKGGYASVGRGLPADTGVDCRITLATTDAAALVSGRMNASGVVMAFLAGRIRVDGDPTVAARLGQILRPNTRR